MDVDENIKCFISNRVRTILSDIAALSASAMASAFVRIHILQCRLQGCLLYPQLDPFYNPLVVATINRLSVIINVIHFALWIAIRNPTKGLRHCSPNVISNNTSLSNQKFCFETRLPGRFFLQKIVEYLLRFLCRLFLVSTQSLELFALQPEFQVFIAEFHLQEFAKQIAPIWNSREGSWSIFRI